MMLEFQLINKDPLKMFANTIEKHYNKLNAKSSLKSNTKKLREIIL